MYQAAWMSSSSSPLQEALSPTREGLLEKGWRQISNIAGLHLQASPVFHTSSSDVGITLWVLDIGIPDANYEDGSAQGLDELDPQGKETPT